MAYLENTNIKITKTVDQTLLSLQSVAASSIVSSSTVDVTDYTGATVYIHFGRRSATAAGAGVNMRVEASPSSTATNQWYPIFEYTTDFTACEAEAVNGTVNAGTNVITVASTTNLTAGDKIYIDNGTIANSEWGRIRSISTNVSVTIEDNLVNAQTGATLYDKAEIYAGEIDLRRYKRMRVLVDGSSFTQAFAVELFATYFR